jgi:hypothetical protein
MPPRWLALSIVAFWIAMSGLFFWRDVLPRLNPTEPLMFPVELVDEAGSIRNQNLYDVGWTVSKNGAGGYVANVEWNYVPESDSFDSHCTLRHGESSEEEKPRGVGPMAFPQLHDIDMESHYFMTRKGQMHSFSVKSQYTLVATKPKELEIVTKVSVEGEPGDRQFVPHITMSLAPEKGGDLLPPLEERAPALEVGERHLVLNPLHPVRRFPSLQAGQHWRVTIIDPLAAFGALPRTLAKDLLSNVNVEMAPSAFVLEAQVQSEQENLSWEGKVIPCRIIQIGDNPLLLSMTLWVSVSDGLVMKQEVSLTGDSWVMVRRLHPQMLPSGKNTRKKP